jgi:hypothetical protein
MNDLRYVPTWRPAYGPPIRRLAQAAGAAPEAPIDRALASPNVALATDVVAVGMSSYVALHLGRINSGWSTFWWVVATASVMKGLHDWKRVKAQGRNS